MLISHSYSFSGIFRLAVFKWISEACHTSYCWCLYFHYYKISYINVVNTVIFFLNLKSYHKSDGSNQQKGDRTIPYLHFLEITWRKRWRRAGSLAVLLNNCRQNPWDFNSTFWYRMVSHWKVGSFVNDQANLILPISIIGIKQWKTLKWVLSFLWHGVEAINDIVEYICIPALNIIIILNYCFLFPFFFSRLLFSNLSLFSSVNADVHKLFHWWQGNDLAQF